MKKEKSIHGMRFTRNSAGASNPNLPNKDGFIVCACLNPKYNPDAPLIILAGSGAEIERSAALLCEQTSAIPVFVKEQIGRWCYGGHFTSSDLTGPEVIADQKRRSGRRTITRVIRMVPVRK